MREEVKTAVHGRFLRGASIFISSRGLSITHASQKFPLHAHPRFEHLMDVIERKWEAFQA